MLEKEYVDDLSTKCGLDSKEYINLLSSMRLKNEEDLFIENINLENESKYNVSNVKLLTGIPELDNLTKGLGAGVHVIAGFRKCCKSTLAINLMYRALNDGLNVCMLSLEMLKLDILNTLISLHSFEVNPQTAITREELSMIYELDKERYNSYLYSFLSLPGNLIIYTEKDLENNSKKSRTTTYSSCNFASMFNQANKLCYKKTGKPVQVLVVDNLNCIRSWEGSSGEKAYSKASGFFRQSALNFGNLLQDENDNCYGNEPVICLLLCQINRTGGSAALYSGFYPDSCIAETVNIERDATTVIPIYTNQMYIDSNIAMVKLEASRYSEAMINPIEVPVHLKYGKIGYPIEHINTNAEKEKLIKLKNEYRLVTVELPNGDEEDIVLPKDAPIPDGYKEVETCYLDYEEDY